MRTPMFYKIYHKKQFMRPMGDISFHFLSRAPQPTANYLTIISPCDDYVWALLAASVAAISLTLMIVDISYAKWTNTSMKGVLYQSMLNAPQSFKIRIQHLIYRYLHWNWSNYR